MFKLFKRGKIYHYSVCLNGKQYRGSTKADNKDLAALRARKIYEEIYTGKFGLVKTKHTCADFVGSYLDKQSGNMSSAWAYTTRKLLEKFVKFLDDKGVDSTDGITPAIIEEYKAELLTRMAPVSVKNNMRVISALFNHSIRLKLVSDNPVRLTAPIRGIEKNKQRYLTKEEIALVSEASVGTWLHDIVAVAIYTGMRRKELVFLEYSDIDLDNGLIYIRNKASVGFQTKSRRERTVPMHEKILPILSRKKEGYCFVNHNGGKLTPRQLTEDFTAFTKSLGLCDVGLHTLRHTFASHLAMNGVSLWEIAKLMGHSSTSVTELYSHLCPNRREVEKLSF